MSIFFDHHIIPKLFVNHPAFQDIDKQTFDIDSPANRIYLPANRELAAKLDVSPHPGKHVSSYTEAVGSALDRIVRNPNPSDRAAEIRTLIDAMRVGFANGDLYANVPIGKTREEVDRGNEKVLRDHKAYLDQHPDQLRAIRDLEQRGADAGLDHLIKWLLYLDNPGRRKLLDEVIGRNPGVNITADNQDLEGTGWQSKFAASDPSANIFRIPGLPPASLSDFPSLPGYNSPSLAGLDEQEKFTRSDPRLTGVLPAFPALSPNEQRLGQLPSSTAVPPDPLVLRFDPATGAPLPFSERSPILDPDPPSGGTPPNALYGVAALAALMAVAPAFAPIWGALGAAGLVGAASARDAGAESSAGGILPAGTTPYNAFDPNNPAAQRIVTNSLWPAPGSQDEKNTLDQEPERASTFVDRFGNWTDTPAGAMPAQDASAAPSTPAAGTVAPEEVRRLTRANASNAGSVFTSGSAPVPHLPPTEFSDRFGNWSMPTERGLQQASRPIGAFADEPSYVVPPPIFGLEDPGNPRNDAEEWFSRWIRPLLRQE